MIRIKDAQYCMHDAKPMFACVRVQLEAHGHIASACVFLKGWTKESCGAWSGGGGAALVRACDPVLSAARRAVNPGSMWPGFSHRLRFSTDFAL
jgi:hypothetical protein